jgi:hypothetical protein
MRSTGNWCDPLLHGELPVHPSTKDHLTATFKFNISLYKDSGKNKVIPVTGRGGP